MNIQTEVRSQLVLAKDQMPLNRGQQSTVDTRTFRRTHYETNLRYHFAQRTPNYIIVT